MNHLSAAPLFRHWPTVITIVFIAMLGLGVVHHAGLMWDETLHAASPDFHAQLIKKGTPLPVDLQYYGTFFDFISYFSFRSIEFFFGPFEITPIDQSRMIIRNSIPVNEIVVSQTFYYSKHVITFLFSLLAYTSVACLVGILVGGMWAWLGPLVLLFIPRFWGYSFFNPKDSPFAAAWTVATLLGTLLIYEFLKTEKPTKVGKNKLTYLSIAFSLVVGIASSIRIGGLVILGFVFLSHCFLHMLNRKLISRTALIAIGQQYFLIVFLWFLFVTICHPAAWSNISWIWDATYYLSHHAFRGDLLFAGAYISNDALPWYYLPFWFFITTPLIIQLFFIVGTFFCCFKFPRLSFAAQACCLLVALQIFFLPLVAIGLHSTLDVGIRQFLFVVPGIATIAAAGIGLFLKTLVVRKQRIVEVVLIALLFVSTARDMISLHPYEHIYFNKFAQIFYHQPEKGKSLKQQFETDSLGLTMREAAEWLNEHGDTFLPVYMHGPFHSVAVFLDPKFELHHLAHVKKPPLPSFYYVAPPRGGWDNDVPVCDTLFVVTRKLGDIEIPQSVVKRCDV